MAPRYLVRVQPVSQEKVRLVKEFRQNKTEAEVFCGSNFGLTSWVGGTSGASRLFPSPSRGVVRGEVR